MADTDTGAKPVDQRELMADIDRTRTELARTIDAISDRVSPSKNIQRAREQAGKDLQRAREQAGKDLQRARDQAGKNLQRATDEVRQRFSQIDPVIVGAAVAATVLGAAVLFLWRHNKR
jgi:hypothetical protein